MNTYKLKLILVLFFLITMFLGAQEYWADYFHYTDPDRYDNPALMFGELTVREADNKDSYTVISRNNDGHITEALSLMKGKPNYYYVYGYAEGQLIYRRMEAFTGKGTEVMILSEVIYDYNDLGELRSTSYYSYDFFGNHKVVFTKIYTGSNYIIHDQRPQETDPELIRNLKKLNEEVLHLQELEQRGLIRKIFGMAPR